MYYEVSAYRSCYVHMYIHRCVIEGKLGDEYFLFWQFPRQVYGLHTHYPKWHKRIQDLKGGGAHWSQGEQIRRIFAYWAVGYFWVVFFKLQM
jgi:hypothetical protein